MRREGGGERAYRYLTCKLSERLTELRRQPLNHHSLAPDVTRQCLVVRSLLRARKTQSRASGGWLLVCGTYNEVCYIFHSHLYLPKCDVEHLCRSTDSSQLPAERRRTVSPCHESRQTGKSPETDYATRSVAVTTTLVSLASSNI